MPRYLLSLIRLNYVSKVKYLKAWNRAFETSNFKDQYLSSPFILNLDIHDDLRREQKEVGIDWKLFSKAKRVVEFGQRVLAKILNGSIWKMESLSYSCKIAWTNVGEVECWYKRLECDVSCESSKYWILMNSYANLPRLIIKVIPMFLSFECIGIVENTLNFRILTNMACDLLSIPISMVASESG